MVKKDINLKRRSVVKQIVDNRKEAKIITGLGSPTYDVFDAGDNDSNFYLWGAMGGAAMVGLGLAMANPNLPVIVITGDGEQLMGVGSLATIGVQKPNNLSIIVLDNGYYGETGMQKSHTSFGVDLHKIAKASNFKHCGMTSKGRVIEYGGRIYHDKCIRTYYIDKNGNKELKPFAKKVKSSLAVLALGLALWL